MQIYIYLYLSINIVRRYIYSVLMSCLITSKLWTGKIGLKPCVIYNRLVTHTQKIKAGLEAVCRTQSCSLLPLPSYMCYLCSNLSNTTLHARGIKCPLVVMQWTRKIDFDCSNWMYNQPRALGCPFKH